MFVQPVKFVNDPEKFAPPFYGFSRLMNLWARALTALYFSRSVGFKFLGAFLARIL